FRLRLVRTPGPATPEGSWPSLYQLRFETVQDRFGVTPDPAGPCDYRRFRFFSRARLPGPRLLLHPPGYRRRRSPDARNVRANRTNYRLLPLGLEGCVHNESLMATPCALGEPHHVLGQPDSMLLLFPGWDSFGVSYCFKKKDRPEHKRTDHRQARVVDRKQFCLAQDQLNKLSQNDTQ